MKASFTYLFKFTLLLMVVLACSKSEEGPSATVTPNDFLASAKYSSLVIQIVSVNGYEPTAGAVNNLKTFLEARLNKPSGITVTQSTIPSPGKSSFSIDDIKAVETSHRTQLTSGTKITAFFFFADADYAGNSGSSKVLGVAYGSSSMALFEKTITEYSGDVGQPTEAVLETAVMNHEFGHILGLVNRGTALQSAHQDTANGQHCSNSDCLMYYNVETSDIIANLLGGGVPSLDASCIADLQGNGGK